MSLQSQHSWNLELQRSKHHGSGGISSTPGDQRDTGSGLSIIKVIPDKDLSGNGHEDGWTYRIHCFRKIGKGGFAEVYLGKKYYENRITKEKGYTKPEYAIKVLEYTNEKEFNHVRRVLDIEHEVCESLKALNEPDNKEHNIVKPKQIIRYEDAKMGYILTEYCSGGDLAHYLKDECPGERMSEGKAKNIMTQVTKGVHFLHTLQYIHRDIKPANILRYQAANEDYTYKIADFGLAVKRTNISDLRTMCGTKRFMAPEMDGINLYGPEVDVWSLGVLFFSLLVGKHSQVDATNEETYRPIKKEKCMALYPTDLQISLCTQQLVNHMLKPLPTHRISLKDIETQVCLPIEVPNKAPANRTVSDSGMGSSCTSGSSSANASSTGIFKHLYNNHDRHILPTTLQIVAEESGIERSRYMDSLTPRTNFIRASSNEKYSSNTSPMRPFNINAQYSHEMNGILPKFHSIAPEPQQVFSSSDHFNCSPYKYSSLTVDSAYRNKERTCSKPARLNTLRLRPSTKEHKMRKGTYCIMQDGSVKMELSIEKRCRQRGEMSILGVKETLLISADGQKVVVKRDGGQHIDSDYSYDDLPEKYWAKYNKAAEVVKSIKAFTPKIIWTTNQATCKMMENGNHFDSQSDANFVVEFNCGVKFEYDAFKGIVTVSDKIGSNMKNEKHSNYHVIEKTDYTKIYLLNSRYGVQCELFKKYHERVRKIDENFEELQAKDLSINDMKDCTYFPLRLGPSILPNTTSYSEITSTYSNANMDNNENKMFLANQNRAYSAGELKRMPLTDQNHKPVYQRTGKYSPSLPQTRSSPNMQKY